MLKGKIIRGAPANEKRFGSKNIRRKRSGHLKIYIQNQ